MKKTLVAFFHSDKWKVISGKWQVEEETPWGVSENIFIKFRQS